MTGHGLISEFRKIHRIHVKNPIATDAKYPELAPGHLAECGTHDDLIAKANIIYYHLHRDEFTMARSQLHSNPEKH